jgi:hypothetical protein
LEQYALLHFPKVLYLKELWDLKKDFVEGLITRFIVASRGKIEETLKTDIAKAIIHKLWRGNLVRRNSLLGSAITNGSK